MESALAGRQYPQTRVFAAGWSEHNRCLLGLHDIVQADVAEDGGGGVCGNGSIPPGNDHDPRPQSTVQSELQEETGSRHQGSSSSNVTGSNGDEPPNVEVMDRSIVAPASGNGFKTEQKGQIKAVIATEDQINRAPVGNSNH